MLANGYKETSVTTGGAWHFVPYSTTLLPNARVLVAQMQRVKQQPTVAVTRTLKICSISWFPELVSFASNGLKPVGGLAAFTGLVWFGFDEDHGAQSLKNL